MNLNTDTSDDAFKKWYDEEANIQLLSTWSTAEFAREAWAEAVCRCEAQMEERERKAFEAAAFAFAKVEMPVGYVGPSPTWLDEAYRKFKEQNP